MYFTILYFTFYGMMTMAITPNHNIAAILSSAFYAIWNIFSGFIVPQTVTSNTLHAYMHMHPCLVLTIFDMNYKSDTKLVG